MREDITKRIDTLHDELAIRQESIDLFELRDGKLYFRDKSTQLMTKKGGLKSVNEIVKILGNEGLRDLDLNIPKGKVTARQT